MLPEELRENPTAAAFADIATTGKLALGELTIEISAENILEALRRAKHDLKFERLSTVTGVDRYPAEPRFEVVYHLQAIQRREWLRLKVRLPGSNPEVESAFAVYRSANWYERETFDLFGIRFLNHPDLRRIMMPDDWPGHPLRKDYPVTGERY
jgi:NADH-quinone oxidoreductase subunit C